MSTPETVDPLTDDRRAFREQLIDHEWMLPSRAAVLPGPGSKAVAVHDGVGALIGGAARENFFTDLTSVRFPLVFAVKMLEQTDYVASFLQLLGTISSFLGGQSEHRQLIAEYDHTGFGLERIVLALANHHGLDLDQWPRNVRTRVGIGT
jgi:hypothetical protein